jgi:ornithine carbamoyltransferase
MRHFLSFEDFSKEEILEILEISKEIKNEYKSGVNIPYLERQVLGMIFEKSSTRTRVSFESGIFQLGGQGIFLDTKKIQMGRGEPISDTSRVISSMVNMVMFRTYEHSTIEEFAKFSKVPVINGLTDLCHPAQVLADYLTILENGIERPKIAYIGDGNNMANSLIMFSAKMGLQIGVATPEGYEPDREVFEKSREFAKKSGGEITLSHSPKYVTSGADVIITDTWVSMGDEGEKDKRLKDFSGFIVDEDLFSNGSDKRIFLHCLPAYRGYEVSEGVIDGERSRVFQEAENRLHSQKGLMVWLSKRLKNSR